MNETTAMKKMKRSKGMGNGRWEMGDGMCSLRYMYTVGNTLYDVLVGCTMGNTAIGSTGGYTIR
jgi:hypothetical protein